MADSAASLISSVNYGGGTKSVSFTDIPQTFTHLRVVADFMSDPAAGESYGTHSIYCRANGDTGTNYNYSYCAIGGSFWSSDSNTTYGFIGNIDGDLAAYVSHNPMVMNIFNYSADEPTTWQGWSGRPSHVGADGQFTFFQGGVAKASAAWGITSLEFYATTVDMATTSRLTLIGMSE